MDKVFYIIAATVLLYMLGKLYFIFLGRGHSITKHKPKHPGKSYRLIYSDQKQVEKEEGVIYSELLSCEKLDITGKPDYIYKGKDGVPMPVEVKSGEIGESEEPHKGDLMQLAAYFAIIEEHFGAKPKEGLIIYRDFMFKVKNTKRLRNELKRVLKDMRTMLKDGEGEPAASFVLCRNCVCRQTVCEFSD